MNVRGLLRTYAPPLALVALPAALLTLGWSLGMARADDGSPAILHSVFTLLLTFTVLVAATSLGRRLIGVVPLVDALDAPERLSFSFALGLGMLGFGVYGLGLVGLLRPTGIAVVLLLVALGGFPAVAWLQQDMARAASDLRNDWKTNRLPAWFAAGLVALIAFLTALLALAPPWGYDGLMYHLVAPRLFLEAGRILPLPEILQANGPLLIQMLYGVGLAFGTDTFSQVVHWAFAGALAFALLGAGRRLLGPSGGWVAAALLLGIPIFPLWGTLPYVDMAQAFYEFLAVWSIFRWSEAPRRSWLVLAAVMAGLALGTKLMALFMLPGLCLWIVVLARRQGWVQAVGYAASFAVLASIVAAPWYLFNFISLGDPLYPFLRGDVVWPPARVLLHLDYLRSFGAGRSLLDFILLPWNLYARHEVFAALMASIEFPSFLFPLGLLVPFVSITPRARPLGWFALFRLGTWFVGSQQTRFLLSLYPVLCLMAAAVLLGLESRLRLRWRFPILTGALAAGTVVTTLVYVAIFTIEARPYAVLLGTESRDDYLNRKAYDYRAMTFIRENLPEDARVLELWDGQSYYCDEKCLPDAGQVQAVYLYQLDPTVQGMAAALQSKGVTHLLLDLEGLNFLLGHDPKGTHDAAARFYLREFLPECGRLIYEEVRVRIYQLACPPQVGLSR